MPTAVQLVDIPLPSVVATSVKPTRVYNRVPGAGRYQNKLASERDKSKWEKHQFICFDGEGCNIGTTGHQYVYLSAYDGVNYREITNVAGLSTLQCFKFLTETASLYKYGICVIYGGSYDSNMMLRDVPIPLLERLHKGEKVWWGDWYLEYIPRKYIQISNPSISKKHSIRLWDVIGFFQSTFVESLHSWLELSDKTILQGKRSRRSFTIEKLPFIVKYCRLELLYFEQLVQRLWECLDRAGIKLQRWDGAGAAAGVLLKMHGVAAFKGSEELQAQHYHLARAAYAGGRFECIRPGDYQCSVYNYDINSAYPAGMVQLPEFTGLVECLAEDHSSCSIEKYDLVKVEYHGDIMDNFFPYFHRDNKYNVSFPGDHIGWHWAPEYLMAARYGHGGNILLHYRLQDNEVRPFSWVGALYTERRALKARGDKAEFALKLALNALYGKLVQQKGWHPGGTIPVTHQLYWGGWITSYTRSLIYGAMMQQPDSIISVDTDGIYTTAPLDLDIGEGLGQWGVTEYKSMTIVQSGVYFLLSMDDKEIAKYRGLDKGSLKREHIYKAWSKGRHKIKAHGTRFRTLGTSLVGARISEWRQWITEPKEIDIGMMRGKRIHDMYGCQNKARPCKRGIGYSHTTMAVPSSVLESVPYNVLWHDTADKELVYAWQDEANEELIQGE